MINYHFINVKMTWVVSAAALDRGKMPALQNPALTFWTDCSGELKTARTQNLMKLFLLLYCIIFNTIL